jgi:hypothetical protein
MDNEILREALQRAAGDLPDAAIVQVSVKHLRAAMAAIDELEAAEAEANAPRYCDCCNGPVDE